MYKIIETIKIKIRRRYMQITSKWRSKKINNNDFTIISNNCWAGFVYQSYNLEYQTPTIGLFFMADDYIKFISNLKYYLSIENIKFINFKESKWYNSLKEGNTKEYPIGVIDDIEIHFLHYKTSEEAEKKWNYRKQRVNYNNILYKFSEMNDCTEKNIKDFQNLKVDNKICFLTNKYKKYKNNYTIIVKVSRKRKDIPSSKEPFGHSVKVNINNVINGLTVKADGEKK